MDIFDLDRAEEIARSAEGKIRAIKINWPIVMSGGIGIVGRLSRYADILCDFKVADIPNTDRLIAQKAAEAGAWGIITHIITGKDSLEALKSSAGRMKVVGVVAMSHPGYRDFMKEHMHAMLQVAKESDIYGIIAPGNDYATINELKRNAGSLKLITPGVGAQGGKASEAISSGADCVIVGRAIYEANDPLSVIEKLNTEISDSAKRTVQH